MTKHTLRLSMLGCAAASTAMSLFWAGAASAATDAQPPTKPHLFAVRGLGGCEIDLRIGLSTDDVTPQSSIRYQVLSNGVFPAGDVFLADTRGSKPGFGNLDAFAGPSGGVQTLTVRAVDQAGNVSAPSNSITRNVGNCNAANPMSS